MEPSTYNSDNVENTLPSESNPIYHELTTAVSNLQQHAILYNNSLQYPSSYQNITETITNTITESPSDCEMKILLKNWGLEHLYSHFIEEKITISILKIIKMEHVKELLKDFKMGDRILFENQLENWRDGLNIPMNTTLSNFFKAHINSPSTSIHGSDQSLNNPENSNRSSPYTIRDRTPEPRDTISITLGNILNKNRKGSMLQDYYNSYLKFDEEQRNLLISIIANYFDSNNLHLSLATTYRLEKEIVERFPSEKIEYYRIGKRGKIYIKFSNLKRNMKGISKYYENKDSKNEDQPERLKNIVPEKDAEACIRSLKFDNLSNEEFESLWQACAHHRIYELTNKCNNLSEIFKFWPQYKNSNGYRLIDKDFQTLFGDQGGILTDWELKIKKIYKFLKEDNHIKDHKINFVLNSITDTEIETGSTTFIFKTFWSLHGYLSPTSKAVRKDKNRRKQTTRHTMKDSQESFEFIGQSMQQLEDHIDHIKSRQENIQPFILALGSEYLSTFESFWVYLEGTKLHYINLLRCKDICFKAIHLFNLEYPPVCVQF